MKDPRLIPFAVGVFAGWILKELWIAYNLYEMGLL